MATRKRTTFNVADMRQWVNEQLARDYFTAEHKHGLANALDHILHKTGNYKGFGYVYIDDVRPCLPGETGTAAVNPRWTPDHEYRRVYY